MKLGYLILRKISKFVATRCQKIKAKNAPDAISAGAFTDPAEGAGSAPPDFLAGFNGPKEREGVRFATGTGSATD